MFCTELEQLTVLCVINFDSCYDWIYVKCVIMCYTGRTVCIILFALFFLHHNHSVYFTIVCIDCLIVQ